MRSKPNNQNRKRKMEGITELFNCVTNDDSLIVATCKYCNENVQATRRLNITRLRGHLSNCDHVPVEKKAEISGISQKAAKLAKLAKLTPNTPNTTIGGESFSQIRSDRIANTRRQLLTGSHGTSISPFPGSRPSSEITGSIPVTTSTEPLRQRSIRTFADIWPKDRVKTAIRCIAETILPRYEPASRIEDPFFLAQMQILTPGLAKVLPSRETLAANVFTEIDADCSTQLTELGAQIP